MVYIVNGQLGRIPTHPYHGDAKACGAPLYAPFESDRCPDHPASPRFTCNDQCRDCWLAEQPARAAT